MLLRDKAWIMIGILLRMLHPDWLINSGSSVETSRDFYIPRFEHKTSKYLSTFYRVTEGSKYSLVLALIIKQFNKQYILMQLHLILAIKKCDLKFDKLFYNIILHI